MSLAVLDFGPLTETIQFLMEIDKLKDIQRRTKVIASLRQENSAEHSWHFAVAAMSLAPYAGPDVDINRVIKMALLHDIVEIDAGDVIVYDLAARAAIHELFPCLSQATTTTDIPAICADAGLVP